MSQVQIAGAVQDVDSTPEVEITNLADTPELVPLLAQWHHSHWGHLTGACTIEKRIKRLNAHLQRHAIPTTFVAWKDGKTIGNASLVANEIAALSEWLPWLANVYVLPEYRRHGTGAQLVQRVAAEAIELGYPRLYLYTLDQMPFYESMNWQLSHLRHHRGQEMSVMVRDLIAHPPPPVKR